MIDPNSMNAQAEARLAASPAILEPQTPEMALRTLHDLRVHQIELEMQNEELRRTQAELGDSRARYLDLYDMAPVGYCTISDKGVIREANLAAAALLAVTRSALVSRPLSRFIFPQDQDVHYAHRKRLIETGVPQTYELRLVRSDGSPFWAQLTTSISPARDTPAAHGSPAREPDAPDVLVVMTNIAASRLAASRQQMSAEILAILNTPLALVDAVTGILNAIQRHTGCDAVGIRLRQGDDFPYLIQHGFSKQFLFAENTLTVRDGNGDVLRDPDGGVKLECTCGLVLSGKADPANPLFTKGGSAWVNDTRTLLTIPPSQDPRTNPRDRCAREGHCSLALIPIRANGKIVGLLQLNDRRRDQFTLERIEFFEGLSGAIGLALIRIQVEEALREGEALYRALVKGLPDIVMRFDREGRHLFVSENILTLVDIPASGFIGKTHAELGFPETECRRWERAIREVFDEGVPFETELDFQGKQGLTVLNWRLVPQRDEQGKVHSVLSLSRDIGAQRRAEENYRMLFHEMLDGFALHEIICDAQGTPCDYRFLAVNPAFERLTGLKAGNVVGRTVREVIPSIESHWIETYGQVALTGKPAFFTNTVADIGKHFEVTAFRPAPNQFACIFADVTERKRTEAATARHLEELRRWQETMLNRSDRSQELKREINHLLSRLGEPPRYASQAPADTTAPGQP